MSALLRGILSNHVGDYYCLNCFHSKSTDNVLKQHERLWGKHDYCHTVMPEEDKNILKYHHEKKLLKAPFAIYADLECLLVKEQSCQNNLEKFYTERKAKHEPSGYSLSLICSSDSTKNRHYLYRGKDCIKNFCKKLKELGTEIINYPEKEMIQLTDKEIKSCMLDMQKKWFCTDKDNEKEFKLRKRSESIAILQENLEELLIVFAIQDANYLKKFQQYFITVQHMIAIL